MQMKIGITFSAFDLLHAGHIKMLEEAKRHCDYLICGLQTNPTIENILYNTCTPSSAMESTHTYLSCQQVC